VFLLTILLLLTACQSNKVEKLTKKAESQELPSSQNDLYLTMENDYYTVSSKEITAIIQNKSNIEIDYGKHFALQKNVDGTWYHVPFKSDIFEDIGVVLGPNKTTEQTLSLDRLKNNLSPGKYRLLKPFSEFKKDYYEQEKIILAAPFEVKNP
jgi:3-deoxy-D-arabino-heptulosonate 7-phosphate (DAHP) synthase class II